MADTLLLFPAPVADRHGTEYEARACGVELPDGTWQGWLEFLPARGGEAIRSARETTQPNRVDTEYWASGLSAVYLEGALERALNPLRIVHTEPPGPPAFEGPAAPIAGDEHGHGTRSVLNPFSVYEKGEAVLRAQLGALQSWHLVNLIIHYGLSADGRARLNALSAAALTDLIVASVREQVEARG
jgi:hypothetical protein